MRKIAGRSVRRLEEAQVSDYPLAKLNENLHWCRTKRMSSLRAGSHALSRGPGRSAWPGPPACYGAIAMAAGDLPTRIALRNAPVAVLIGVT